MSVDRIAEVEKLAAIARDRVVPAKRRRMIGAQSDATDVAFDLYHFGGSVCSGQVRATLAELGVSWASFEVAPQLFEQYHLDYVRLRLASSSARKREFASGWTGRSSVRLVGFDATALPTLVDHRHAEVVADSTEIARHLAASLPGGEALYPNALARDIDIEVAAADRLPHPALRYGAAPLKDKRARRARRPFDKDFKRKTELLAKRIEQAEGESYALEDALSAKVEMEHAGVEFFAEPAHMQAAVEETETLIETLANRLTQSSGRWCLGDHFTLADIFWGVALFHLEFQGYGRLYRTRADLGVVASFADRVMARPAIQASVTAWPTQPWAQSVAQWMQPPRVMQRLLG